MKISDRFVFYRFEMGLSTKQSNATFVLPIIRQPESSLQKTESNIPQGEAYRVNCKGPGVEASLLGVVLSSSKELFNMTFILCIRPTRGLLLTHLGN